MAAAKSFIIYRYTSPSKKSYIGQTCDVTKRIRTHKSTANLCVAFANAIKKYGYDTFEFEILEENLTLDEANIREEYYIAYYNTIVPNGYNLLSGGLNRIPSEETRQRHREAVQGEKNPFFGKSHTDNTKQLLSIANRGKTHSQETIQLLSENSSGEKNKYYGKFGDEHPAFGYKHTEDHKKYISKKLSGKNNPMYGINGDKHPSAKFYYITYPDGTEKIIKCLTQFCKDNGLSRGKMTEVSRGTMKQHKGFKCNVQQGVL